MAKPHANGEGDGIISLVKETADGLGHLIGDHIKLARVEMVADAKAYGRYVGLLTVAGAFLVLGYGFGLIALGLGVARWIGAPLAFLAIAGVHLLGGAVGLAVVMRGLKTTRVMDETVSEVSRSVAALAQVSAPRLPPPQQEVLRR